MSARRRIGPEWRTTERLFGGASFVVSRQLGHVPARPRADDGRGDAAAALVFRAWAGRQADDPDLGQDARMMVPVFYNVERRRTKVWAFLGWSRRPVQIGFFKPPRTEALTAFGRPVTTGHPEFEFPSVWESLA